MKIDYSKISEHIDDGCQPSPEEIEAMEECYRMWVKELEEAIASGDQSKIDEVYEQGA